MKILVTGGSGYLGRHVRSFFGADDFSRRSRLDVLNPFDAEAVADYDVVIHLAALLDKNPAASSRCFQTNADGTANLLRHMRSNSVFIYASTKDVYGGHADSYDEVPETCSTEYRGQSALEWSKLIGERFVDYYASQRDLRACIFRMSAIYARASDDNESGFVTHYVESVKRDWPIKLPAGGRPVRDILHVDDFSQACRAFIDSTLPRGLYNLGGGRENSASLREIIEKVGRLIDKAPVLDEDAVYPSPIPFNYISDLRRIRRELGWQPRIAIEAGLRSLL
jgi:CDP-paratose 2-epimerase